MGTPTLTVMLGVNDFHANAKAPQFGPYEICSVRYGKAMQGPATASLDGMERPLRTAEGCRPGPTHKWSWATE